MFASVKALLFGEDMSSDPVSKTLGLVLRVFSGGAVTIDVHTFSQYLTLIFIGFISISSLRCADLLLRCVACALAIPWAGMLCIEPLTLVARGWARRLPGVCGRAYLCGGDEALHTAMAHNIAFRSDLMLFCCVCVICSFAAAF